MTLHGEEALHDEQQLQGERASRSSRGRVRWLVLVVVLAVLATGGVVGVRWWQAHSNDRALAGKRLQEFPAVDRTGLDDFQLRVLDVAKREYGQQHDGTTYSEGIKEAWCADFVSWVMRDAGQPLENPNSGSWRIPGVATLEQFYREQHRFEEPGYQPHPGDVVMYAPGSAFGQHTNIVISAVAGTLTTVGGNEFGRISIHEFRPADVPGVVGYGRLGT
ncbi:CHAP domain-containing protein [Nocardia sp. NPDC006630]|uniref:CHAP domain-containing protein n=1 Tax=Nocardia sp. NPDC006630 TaxID=3157181 RepID=UPI0033B7750C